jgi:hypothetical protein
VKQESELDLAEQQELDLLAAELRDAMPVATLSDAFHERLEARIRDSWTLRGAFRRNGLIRVAAGLLVITLAAAPVAAWVGLWPQQAKKGVVFSQEPFREKVQVDGDGDTDTTAVLAPVDEFDDFEWTAERSLAVERTNRLASAAVSWQAAFGNTGDCPDFSIATATEDWARADWSLLWSEFQRRCAESDSSMIPASLVARCAVLSSTSTEDGSATARAARAAWTWVLQGQVAAAGSVELAWPSAPFVAAR